MGNSCSCLDFCQPNTEIEPEKEEYPISTGKQDLNDFILIFIKNFNF